MGIFGFPEAGNDVCVPGRDSTSVQDLPEQAKDLPYMSFNATQKPPSGREREALEVFRKEYNVWDRPPMPRHKGPGLTTRRPRSQDGSPTCRSSDRQERDGAHVCPEGLGPGSRGIPRSTPWTLLADTNRPFGTSDHQEWGNLIQMTRSRSTDLVFPREPL